MKLSELRAEVYRVAEVTTTKQLKAKYANIKSLDMRYKASWQKALKLLQTPEKAGSELQETKDKSAFESWLSNPPDEYKALFDKAESALTSIGNKLAKGAKVTQTAKAMAEGLSDFADASLEEAQKLAKAARLSQDTSKQADLN